MAKNKISQAAKAKEKKQKIILAVGGIVLLRGRLKLELSILAAEAPQEAVRA